MHSPRSDVSGAQRGFVLVGVVMFVLALTILGLSLFALSSYEGQFVDRSTSSVQALDAALSGVEHAKFVLAHRRTLQDVRASLFPNGVVYASARRTDGADPNSGVDSVGSVDDVPPNVAIAIRVLANIGGERRMLQSRFLRQESGHLYRRLMSITDSLYTRDALGPPFDVTYPNLLCGHYTFQGEIWAGNGSGQDITTCAQGMAPSSDYAAQLPTPDVQSFINAHKDDPATQTCVVPHPDHNNTDFSLIGSLAPPQVNYFKTINNDFRGSNECSLYIDWNNNPVTISVSGWIVWLLPEGIHCDRRIVVTGSGQPDLAPGVPHDCLVIVAGKSTDPDKPSPPPFVNYGYLGITFSYSIESSSPPSVPIILVTDGWFFDEHFPFASPLINSSAKVNYISVFARAAAFWGPYTGVMELDHPLGDPRDGPGGLIDLLCNQDALPNVLGGGTSFRPVAGTWRELDPDNPPPN